MNKHTETSSSPNYHMLMLNISSTRKIRLCFVTRYEDIQHYLQQQPELTSLWCLYWLFSKQHDTKSCIIM